MDAGSNCHLTRCIVTDSALARDHADTRPRFLHSSRRLEDALAAHVRLYDGDDLVWQGEVGIETEPRYD